MVPEHDVHGTVQLDPGAGAGRGVGAGEQVARGLIAAGGSTDALPRP